MTDTFILQKFKMAADSHFGYTPNECISNYDGETFVYHKSEMAAGGHLEEMA